MSDYPDNLTLRPIEHWPGTPTRIRVRSQFSASWSATLSLLTTELRHLGGGRLPKAVLQIAMREQDFRIDGLPRASARPEHPGVILSIESFKGPLSFPCDKFDGWQNNLRAIALGLEALRKVDRYGITRNAEQYTGWRAIESKAAPVFATADAAEQFLRTVHRVHHPEEATFALHTRVLRKRARVLIHPDRPTITDPAEVAKINAAIELLEAEAGGRSRHE